LEQDNNHTRSIRTLGIRGLQTASSLSERDVSSRKIERATQESIPFRFSASGLHPDHDTVAHFRKTFLAEILGLFVQILLPAQEAGVFSLGNISLDGSKIHTCTERCRHFADASKHHAVSYKRLLELEAHMRQPVSELFALGEQAEHGEPTLPAGFSVDAELAFRQKRLANPATAKAVLEARAQERYAAEKAAYDAKVRARDEKNRQHKRPARGRGPKPPEPGPRDQDQYNFTDPDSRMMKNSTDAGFDQHYNVQAAVDQASLFSVGTTVSNHPNDQKEVGPTVDAISPRVGQPKAGALDQGYFSESNIAALEARGIEAYIATGREPHHHSRQSWFAEQPIPPPADASAKAKMAYKLQTQIGKAIYGLRKMSVEPVIGIVKEVLGFRQFSLRGLCAVAGEWCLVCLALNLKRLHTLKVR
jgi:Transposase DDE domain